MAVYTTYSDSDLITLIKSSDQTAFTEIFERYNKLLYSHVYNKVRDEEAARDMVQDVFIKLWEKREVIENINLAGYLFTLSRNRLLNSLDRSRVANEYVNVFQQYGQPQVQMPDVPIREKQLAAIIQNEIDALPPRMREIFTLSRYEFLSNKEIAAKLNLSEHTIADQIKKSLKILRLKIGLSIVIGFFCHNNPVSDHYFPVKEDQVKNSPDFFSNHIPD